MKTMARPDGPGSRPSGHAPTDREASPVDPSRILTEPAEHPDNDTLRMLGAFDRKCKVDKHMATHWGYLRSVIDTLDAAGQRDAADVLIWQVWHRVNSAARHHEFYGLLLKDKEDLESHFARVFKEKLRLRRLLSNGPSSPQECAEFCRVARTDGDGKPCIDCEVKA